jgi:hypothetical protein
MVVAFAPDVAAAAAAVPAVDAGAAGLQAENGVADAAGAPVAVGNVIHDGTTWENLKNTADFRPHEVGLALWDSHKDATDAQVVAPLLAMAELPGDVDMALQLRRIVDDPADKYYATVIEGNVEVLHQMRYCHATAGNGQRVLVLKGENTMVVGMIVPPQLQSLRGNLNQQPFSIGVQGVAAATMDAIAAVYAGDPTLELVPAIQAAGDADPQIVSAWKLVEIHPKIAAFLLKGMTVREAFTLFLRIKAAIVPACRPSLRILEDFIRGAVTGTAGEVPVSAMATAWSRLDPHVSPQLAGWYYQVLSKVPRVTIAPPLPLPPLPPAPAQGDPSLLIAALTSFTQARDNPSGRPYQAFELTPLLAFCGNVAPYGGMTEDYLSDFFRQMKAFRSNVARFRAFYDSYRQVNHPAGVATYAWVPSPSVLKDIQNLSFAGGDQLIQYSQRHLGIGPFSVAPSAIWGERDRTAEFAAYEETESMHGPTERAAMTALSTSCAPIPQEITGMCRLVDHLETQMTLLFTCDCPLVPHITSLLKFLRNGARFVNFKPHDFTVFMWALHTACREFFLDQETAVIERLVIDVEQRQSLNNSLPDELLPPPVGRRPVSSLSEGKIG